MSKTINGMSDYKDIEILGLNPKDRSPSDYLRLTARVFNSFKPIDITKTVSSYISGFETTIQKKNIDGVDNLECYILKGSCFIDDQFIGFTDDIVFNVPTSKIVDNVDYYLVLKYQYSNQCIYNPAIFDYIAASQFDSSTMLKIIQFKMSGFDLIIYPQNLDDAFIENYSRLFKLVSDQANELFQINAYQGLVISPNKLYTNIEDPNYSVKPGDVVFLDLDGLYKPARACNRRIDKAIGVYVYTPKSDKHEIVTNGIIDFNNDKLIDDSNKLLLNMEPGKSYYLLDNCSETNYAWENGKQPMPGKISSRFIPGNVKIGFALDNAKFMVQVDMTEELHTANFLELIGLPEHFQDRFNVIYAYWISNNAKDFRNLFIEALQLFKEDLAAQKDSKIQDSENQKSDYLTKAGISENTTLANTPVVTVGNITGPISNNTLLQTIISKNEVLNTYQSQQAFREHKINYLVEYIPDFIQYIDIKKAATTTTITFLNDIKDNFSTKNQSNIFFENEYKIPGFDFTFQDYDGFRSLALPKIFRISVSSRNISLKKIKTSADSPDGSFQAPTNITINIPQYNLTQRSAVGSVDIGTAIGASSTYTETNEIISSNNPIPIFINNLTTYINLLINFSDILDNLKNALNDTIVALNDYDADKLTNLLSETGDSGNSVKYFINRLSYYLFGDPNAKEILASLFGIAKYLNDIYYFIDKDDDELDFNLFLEKIKLDIYSDYYIGRYLVQEMIIVQDYLNTLDATQSQNDTAINDILDTIEVFDTERRNYIDTSDNNFKLYQESLKDYASLIYEIQELDIDIDDYDNRILAERTMVNQLEIDISNLDQSIIDRISNQTSVNSILYISDYERKIYNYTYLTIRIRLKQKLVIAIQNDVDIVTDILLQLKSQTIPDRTLIDKTQANLNSFTAVLDNLNFELQGMLFEYNKLREEFGIDDPVTVDNMDFDDHGLADPNLDCFKNLNTFSTY